MKSKDLMVGDWVVSPMGHPYKAYELTQEFAYFDNSEGELSDILPKVGIKYDALVPIPLTAEILEANGFVYEKDYGSYYRSRWGEIDSDHYVTIGWNSKGEVYQYEVVTTMEDGFRSKKSAYGNTAIAVHSLQHALRLCGLDDLADNFKLA